MGDSKPKAILSATGEAQKLLEVALRELKQTALVDGAESPIFFPNGIELISLTIEISGVKVEFKVAGEKGLGGLDFSVPESEEDVFFEPNGEEF